MISYEDFAKLDLRVGTITEAAPIEEADKLLLLSVSIGGETRQIVAGIKQMVDSPEAVIDRQVVIVANLAPKEMFGHESQGMLLAARSDDVFTLVQPGEKIANGTKVS